MYVCVCVCVCVCVIFMIMSMFSFLSSFLCTPHTLKDQFHTCVGRMSSDALLPIERGRERECERESEKEREARMICSRVSSLYYRMPGRR